MAASPRSTANCGSEAGSLCLRRGDAPGVLKALLAETGAAAHPCRLAATSLGSLSSTSASPRICKRRGAAFRIFGGRLLFEPEAILTAAGSPIACSRPSGGPALRQRRPARRFRRRSASAFAEAESDRARELGSSAGAARLGRGLARDVATRRGAALTQLGKFIRSASGSLCRRPQPARPRRELAPLTASAFRRDQPEPGLARGDPCAARAGAKRSAAPRHSCASWAGASSAIICSPFPAMLERAAQARIRRLPLARRCGRARSLAEGQDRLSDRRRRHARALAHRLHAEPRAHDRRLLPGQASADPLAGRRGLVLRHAGRRRSRQQLRPTGSGWRAAAPMPHPISASSIPCSRARSSIPTAPMCGAGCPSLPALPASDIHAPWEAPASRSRKPACVLGETYPRPIVDHAEARSRALRAFATIGKG